MVRVFQVLGLFSWVRIVLFQQVVFMDKGGSGLGLDVHCVFSRYGLFIGILVTGFQRVRCFSVYCLFYSFRLL